MFFYYTLFYVIYKFYIWLDLVWADPNGNGTALGVSIFSAMFPFLNLKVIFPEFINEYFYYVYAAIFIFTYLVFNIKSRYKKIIHKIEDNKRKKTWLRIVYVYMIITIVALLVSPT